MSRLFVKKLPLGSSVMLILFAGVLLSAVAGVAIMRRALEALPEAPVAILIDGNSAPSDLPCQWSQQCPQHCP